MRSPTIALALVLTLLFVAAGDLLLPQPLAGASYQTRTQLNNILLSLFPETEMNNLRPSRLQELEEVN